MVRAPSFRVALFLAIAANNGEEGDYIISPADVDGEEEEDLYAGIKYRFTESEDEAVRLINFCALPTMKKKEPKIVHSPKIVWYDPSEHVPASTYSSVKGVIDVPDFGEVDVSIVYVGDGRWCLFGKLDCCPPPLRWRY